MTEPITVFVFGTLKSGFPNHWHLAGQEYLGTCATALTYPLYLIEPRHSPWLIDAPGSGHRVRGELYRVDHNCLRELDHLERISEPDGYFRTRIELISDKDSSEFTASCYLKPSEALQDAEIKLGPLAEYQQEHARLYRTRSV
jgi:gamma-glutamylaminecyclotransferase